MLANKCGEYCGHCYPLTITIDNRQYVYRYCSAKNRILGLTQLRKKYPNRKLCPVYACALLRGVNHE